MQQQRGQGWQEHQQRSSQRQLKHRLGDERLLYRALRAAALGMLLILADSEAG